MRCVSFREEVKQTWGDQEVLPLEWTAKPKAIRETGIITNAGLQRTSSYVSVTSCNGEFPFSDLKFFHGLQIAFSFNICTFLPGFCGIFADKHTKTISSNNQLQKRGTIMFRGQLLFCAQSSCFIFSMYTQACFLNVIRLSLWSCAIYTVNLKNVGIQPLF